MVSCIRSPSKTTFRIGVAATRMRAQYVTFAPVNFTKKNVRHIMRIKTTKLMRRNKLVVIVQSPFCLSNIPPHPSHPFSLFLNISHICVSSLVASDPLIVGYIGSLRTITFGHKMVIRLFSFTTHYNLGSSHSVC